MRAIGLIPSRLQSTRLPSKALLVIDGLPVVIHTLKRAQLAKSISDVYVCTDSEKIANIAKNNGAEVPFLRNEKLSDDYTGTTEVLLDCIHKNNSTNVKYHFLIYPTAPLIDGKDLIKAFRIIKKKKFDLLIAMSNYNVSPFIACEKIKNDIVKFYWPKYAIKRSQDLPNLIHDTGTFYIYRTKALLISKKIMPKKTTHYLLHKLKSVDINTIEDFEFAEFLYKFNN